MHFICRHYVGDLVQKWKSMKRNSFSYMEVSLVHNRNAHECHAEVDEALCDCALPY